MVSYFEFLNSNPDYRLWPTQLMAQKGSNNLAHIHAGVLTKIRDPNMGPRKTKETEGSYKAWFLASPSEGPRSLNVRSLCLCGLLGPFYRPRAITRALFTRPPTKKTLIYGNSHFHLLAEALLKATRGEESCLLDLSVT